MGWAYKWPQRCNLSNVDRRLLDNASPQIFKFLVTFFFFFLYNSKSCQKIKFISWMRPTDLVFTKEWFCFQNFIKICCHIGNLRHKSLLWPIFILLNDKKVYNLIWGCLTSYILGSPRFGLRTLYGKKKIHSFHNLINEI